MLTFFVLGLSFVLLIVFYIRYPDATIRFVKAVGPILVSLAIAYVGWIYSEAIENNIMGYGESDTRAKPIDPAIHLLVMTSTASADSPKGQWGRITPIADNNHPNLFYNQSEINELRNMILVQKSPQNLVNVYNNIKSALAAGPGFNGNHPNDNNMRAAISYMIEPTSAKADAIHSALLSFMSTYPGGLLDWADPNGCAFCGYSTAWLFDLLMAYNPEKLSSTEIANLKNFFALSAERLKFNTATRKRFPDPVPLLFRIVLEKERLRILFRIGIADTWGRLWRQHWFPAIKQMLIIGPIRAGRTIYLPSTPLQTHILRTAPIVMIL